MRFISNIDKPRDPYQLDSVFSLNWDMSRMCCKITITMFHFTLGIVVLLGSIIRNTSLFPTK